ncbi:MAG: hypothetical protein R3E56_05590 [Burkholderiaceae bacterium]
MTAWNNRLVTLQSMGLLRERKAGKRKFYSPVIGVSRMRLIFCATSASRKKAWNLQMLRKTDDLFADRQSAQIECSGHSARCSKPLQWK